MHRSSGFRLGITLLQIGNLTTPALSDNKCVLYAVNLPCLLRGLYPLPELESLLPLLEQIVDSVLENLRTDQKNGVSSLDLDLLVNQDERVSNETYFTILLSLCTQWAHQVLEIKDQLELDYD